MAKSAAARAKSRVLDPAAEGTEEGDSIWGAGQGEKSKAWGRREDGSPNKEESLAEIALHSAKANPTPETIKKKPCTTCGGGGGGELDATPSIPIEPGRMNPRNLLPPRTRTRKNQAEIRGLGESN